MKGSQVIAVAVFFVVVVALALGLYADLNKEKKVDEPIGNTLTDDQQTRRATDGTTLKYYIDKTTGVCFALVNDKSAFRVTCEEAMFAPTQKIANK